MSLSSMHAGGLDNAPMTVLYRQGGVWLESELASFAKSSVSVTTHPEYPEYFVLLGHHTKDEALRIIGGGFAFTAKQVVGVGDPALPFVPGLP